MINIILGFIFGVTSGLSSYSGDKSENLTAAVNKLHYQLLLTCNGVIYRQYLFHGCGNFSDLKQAYGMLLNQQYLSLDIISWNRGKDATTPEVKYLSIVDWRNYLSQ